MTVITQQEFENFEYRLISSDSPMHIFACQHEGFEIKLYEGSENEHFWVRFLEDVDVLADADTDPNDLDEDDNRYLNIDACPEIISEYLISLVPNPPLLDYDFENQSLDKIADSITKEIFEPHAEYTAAAYALQAQFKQGNEICEESANVHFDVLEKAGAKFDRSAALVAALSQNNALKEALAE